MSTNSRFSHLMSKMLKRLEECGVTVGDKGDMEEVLTCFCELEEGESKKIMKLERGTLSDTQLYNIREAVRKAQEEKTKVEKENEMLKRELKEKTQQLHMAAESQSDSIMSGYTTSERDHVSLQLCIIQLEQLAQDMHPELAKLKKGKKQSELDQLRHIIDGITEDLDKVEGVKIKGDKPPLAQNFGEPADEQTIEYYKQRIKNIATVNIEMQTFLKRENAKLKAQLAEVKSTNESLKCSKVEDIADLVDNIDRLHADLEAKITGQKKRELKKLRQELTELLGPTPSDVMTNLYNTINVFETALVTLVVNSSNQHSSTRVYTLKSPDVTKSRVPTSRTIPSLQFLQNCCDILRQASFVSNTWSEALGTLQVGCAKELDKIQLSKKMQRSTSDPINLQIHYNRMLDALKLLVKEYNKQYLAFKYPRVERSASPSLNKTQTRLIRYLQDIAIGIGIDKTHTQMNCEFGDDAEALSRDILIHVEAKNE